MVTIPNMTGLSLAQMNEIAQRARQMQGGGALDAENLAAALQDVTPPPLTREEELPEMLELEAQARRALEADGCPPCCPPGEDLLRTILLGDEQDVPDACRAIVHYWKTESADGMPLCAQHALWEKFRRYQQRPVRTRYFDELVGRATERRRRHGLDVRDLVLQRDVQQQTPLARWVEFQDNQLLRLEQLQAARDKAQTALATAEERAARCQTSKRSIQLDAQLDVELATRCLEYSERALARHAVLLRWIEEQRQAMLAPGEGEKGREDKKDKTTLGPRVDRRARVTKRAAPPPPPSPSQRTLRRQTTQPAAPLLPKKEPARPPKQARDEALRPRQSRAQHVTKTARAPGPAVQPVRTRSGRLSRPPERLGSREDGRTRG